MLLHEPNYYYGYDFDYQIEQDIEEWYREDEPDLWDDEWPELSIADLEELYREEAEFIEDHPWFGMDCCNIPSGKLESFINEAKSWKHFDTKNGGIDPYDKHKNAHWRGYRSARNKVYRIVESMVAPFCSVKNITDALKSNIDYKHSHVFRRVVSHLLDSIDSQVRGDLDSAFHWEHSETLSQWYAKDNIIWKKSATYNFVTDKEFKIGLTFINGRLEKRFIEVGI